MNKMKGKPYVVAEYYYPKSEHVEDVMNILVETSAMIKDLDGALMSMSLKPEKKDGPVTGISMWESREKFTAFMKSEHMEKVMKSGLANKVKGWTTSIKADLYTIEQAWHVESHD
jgi:heme-degrading monooxygenase HmoA